MVVPVSLPYTMKIGRPVESIYALLEAFTSVQSAAYGTFKDMSRKTGRKDINNGRSKVTDLERQF